MRFIVRLFVGLIILLILAVIVGFVYLRVSLPQVNGAVRVNGLDGTVEIVRDANGVPHIFASTDHDAFFALGYVHAQDRLWQMEFQRRTGAGRLSEILGEPALATDKFLRTLGTYRAAEATWSHLSEDSQLALEAYAAGVNAWLAEDNILPVEFAILGVKPEPWQPADSLVWAKMMAWNLGGNYEQELLRARLTQAIGPERAAQLISPFPQDGTIILAANQLDPAMADTMLSMAANLESNFQLGGFNMGSNNWVISGDRTESGLPLLANDPHLGAQIPSIWYLAELQGDQLHAIGATLPGLPAVVIGHNDEIAWGVTNMRPDVQDLYLERINPDNLNQYEVEGQWEDLTIIEEEIVVKDEEEPILWAARSTRHGPLLSDVHGSVHTPIAMRWTALDEDDTTVESFITINYARNWQEFQDALTTYVGPSQNFVYADREGNIGFLAPGRIPVRAQGNGMMPVPGWDSEYEWEDWIPFEELPQAYNPEAGFIATANNRVVSDDYPYFLTNDWSPPYRAERIVELIEEASGDGKTMSLEAMMTIQADQRSAQTRQLLPYLQQIIPRDERQTQALAYLAEWDGVARVDSAATAIYVAWFAKLGQTMFEDDLQGDLYDDFVNRRSPIFLQNLMEDQDNVWCDNFLTTPEERCLEMAAEALDRALDELESLMGKNMSRWQWGKVHRTQYTHNPFSRVDPLKPIFHREIANGGDTYTVNVASTSFSQPFLQFDVPSYRHIIDLSDWNNSLFMHTTGQSGNIMSAHYDDLIERHQAVEYIPMTFGRDQVSGDSLLLQSR